MPHELNRMIEKGRQAFQGRGEDFDGPDVPPGFVDRVLRERRKEPSESLLLWQRVSWAGTACALAVALVTMWQIQAQPDAFVADPWMEMPMEPMKEGGAR
ncbi:hypothetical protein [Haloferula sp.]|uniref:hypothetical protein n=1 Tax=Haloferula sp. TaxID=2497595 RepID=UPI00329C2B07